jgi:hypothetical protein
MNSWLPLQSLQRSPVGRGGLCDLLCVPIEDVRHFPDTDPVSQTITQNIILKNSKSWLSFSSLSTYGKSLKEELQVGPAGFFFKQSVGGMLTSQNQHNHLQLANMVHHQWIVLSRERSTALTYVVGKPTAGCNLGLIYETKRNTITEISFTTESKYRSALYGGLTETAPGTRQRTFLTLMLKEFKVGSPGFPNPATKFIVEELEHRLDIAIFVDGVMISQQGYNDRLACTYTPGSNQVDFTRQLAIGTLVQIYEVV